MDDTTDRERELANCLFQIDKLCDADLRAVLRHLATDDAVFSEAQCSHIASVVDGTLHQKPREAVNAKLGCASGFDAALNWEKSFATYAYPGHISDGLRDYAENQMGEPASMQLLATSSEAVESGEDMVLFGTNAPSIANKAHMNIHYHHHHYYKHSQADDLTRTIPMKREREDDDYPEGPSAPIATDKPKTDDMLPKHPSKRARLQEQTKNVKTEMEEMQAKPTPNWPSVEKGHKPQHVEGKICKVCGVRFTRRANTLQTDGKLPCRHHAGVLHPSGDQNLNTSGEREISYKAWSCCHAAPDDAGCVYAKHTAK